MDESGLIYGTKCLESDIEPQREQLLFQYDPADVPSEMAGVMDSIKELAEKTLFHWREFPIVLPSSITDNEPQPLGAANGDISKERLNKVTFRDVFIAPTFDELEEVARMPNGGQKKLNEKQLYCIWDNGEFEVDSIHFPGQTHKWHLSQLLQKGSRRSHETLLDDMALALRILLITARNRFHSHFFSLSEGFKSWGRGLWKIFDIIIGMPSTSPGDLTAKLREEHMRYLVAELDIRHNCRKEFNRFCEYVKDKCKMLRAEKHKTADLRPPPIPYYYQTPQGLHIDLRLFNKDLINNCLPILSNIVEKESRGWHIQYRQKLVRELKAKGYSNEQITEEVSTAVMNEYLQRVYRAVQNNIELENLQHGIGQLLIAQAQSVLAMQKAVQNIQQKMVEHKEKLIEHLRNEYPVKSRITAWKNEQLQRFEEEFINQNLWSAHEIAISLCEEQQQKQAIYFLRRDLNFIKEREHILRKELGRVKVPTQVFTFSTKIWFPQHWMIVRQTRGDTEVMPTIIKDGAVPAGPVSKKDHDTFTVDKYLRRKTSTRYPMWRWWNYVHRTWAWMWNSMFFFWVVIPWCSPVSFRALFYTNPFKPDLELSPVDGALYPKESSLTHTLISRLRLLWKNVRESRASFEEAPDTGFLGKSLTRYLNQIWNFVLKGGFGSMILVLIFPLLCILISGLSLIIALTTPLWMPIVTLFAHIGFFLIYDLDCPEVSGNKILVLLEAILWHILLQGCVQPVAAIIFGAIFCPLAALFCLLFGIFRRGARGLWDSVMFHTVIKSRGRIPANDGFIARRVAGPGLASNYFFQIKAEQSLAAIEAKLELDELEAWKNNVLKVIEYPEEEYRKFVKQCFKPFSADVTEDGVYKKLCLETAQYKSDLVSKVDLIVGEDDGGELFTPEQYEQYKKEVVPLRIQNRLYTSWVSPTGMDCKLVGPETPCFCQHRYKQHKTDFKVIPTERPIKLPCRVDRCGCLSYHYVPLNGSQPIRCHCKHTADEHLEVEPYKCKKPNCGKCFGFSSSFTCGCGQLVHAHQMIVETAKERIARGHPVGQPTPYAAMGGITGFSSLADGYLRLDPSGAGAPSSEFFSQPILPTDHAFLKSNLQTMINASLAGTSRGLSEEEKQELEASLRKPDETELEYFERRYQERVSKNHCKKYK